MKIKLRAHSLPLVLGLTLLSACGGGDEGSTDEKSKTASGGSDSSSGGTGNSSSGNSTGGNASSSGGAGGDGGTGGSETSSGGSETATGGAEPGTGGSDGTDLCTQCEYDTAAANANCSASCASDQQCLINSCIADCSADAKATAAACMNKIPECAQQETRALCEQGCFDTFVSCVNGGGACFGDCQTAQFMCFEGCINPGP